MSNDRNTTEEDHEGEAAALLRDCMGHEDENVRRVADFIVELAEKLRKSEDRADRAEERMEKAWRKRDEYKRDLYQIRESLNRERNEAREGLAEIRVLLQEAGQLHPTGELGDEWSALRHAQHVRDKLIEIGEQIFELFPDEDPENIAGCYEDGFAAIGNVITHLSEHAGPVKWGDESELTAVEARAKLAEAVRLGDGLWPHTVSGCVLAAGARERWSEFARETDEALAATKANDET